MKPSVSVAMTTRNRPNIIANAINSIRNQTISDWELIIIDDGSTEIISDTIKKFDDKRIFYYKRDHRGIVSSINEAIKLCTSNIIALQGDDDLSLPDRLEKSLSVMEDNDVIHHGLYKHLFDEALGCIHREYVHAEPIDKRKILASQYIPGVPLFRKKLWIEKPFRIETQFAYDWMMYLDWFLSGAKFISLDVGLYEYIRYKDSASVQYEKDGRREKSVRMIKEIVQKEYGETVA